MVSGRRWRRSLFWPKIWTNLRSQLGRIDDLDTQIADLEKQLGGWQKQEAACRAISEIPGIGRLTATALVATRVW